MPVEFKSPARKGTPGGNSTFDLFSWYDGSDNPPARPPVRVSATNDSNGFASVNDQQAVFASPVGRPTIRMHQPAGGVSHIHFGEQISQEEADALLKRRPGSESKRREMSGSGIFGADSADGIEAEKAAYTPSVRLSHQPAGGASQISFGGEDMVSPKKPTSIPEVAKQRELCGNLENPQDIHRGRQFSNNKAKELSGSNIFGPPPVDAPRSVQRNEIREHNKTASPDSQLRNIHTSVRVSNPAGGKSQILFGAEQSEMLAKKVHDQKLAELTGSNIFKDETPTLSVEKALSQAKLKEMTGSDIFADERPPPRDSIGGIRKPPDKSTCEGFYSRPLAKQTSERKFREMRGQEIQTVFDQTPLGSDINPIPTSRKPSGNSVSSAKLREMMGSGIFPDRASVWQNCIARNPA